MTSGIDCAMPLTAKSAQALAAHGYRFAARYLVPAGYDWKRLTRAEAEAITAAGMQIVSVFETAARRSAGGALAGHADGALACREAHTVGQPAGSAIYFAVDYDAGPEQYDEIEAYLRAAAAEVPDYRIGVYGSYAVVEQMAKRKVCSHFWQTHAWSRGRKSPFANIHQYKTNVSVDGIAMDLNQSFGQEGWWNTKAAASDNRLDKADADALVRILQATWAAAKTQTDKDEIHRLANVVRRVSGQPEVKP
ncbi:DUF1906 domain-containing protein [Cohnella pontilimi]|uniref:DUF1906 domain-containing protein n=2 Tax=Cohnella pontilimi TaxID=2564100 RepID=A0A4U0F822_9BACL|nr:DUF1906 domain-containing protein [Cohnella pontilimi]